jgi:hypothetical protein
MENPVSTDLTSTKQNSATSTDEDIYEGVPIPVLKKLYRGVTYPIRMAPDFLIIGTQRGGTTSLYRYLKAHPSIGASSNKDVHFFDRRFHKGVSWYRGHFPTHIEKFLAERSHGRPFLTGEASPSYLFHPHAPRRAAQVLPHARLIVLLRDPVSRAYSQYHHARKLGFEHLSFEEAIEAEEERFAREHERVLQDEHYYSETYKHLSYLRKGIYVDQLKAWMSVFPREQFLILKSEEFYADPAATFKQVLAFLGLAQEAVPVGQQQYKPYNNNTYSSKMDPAMRKRLQEYFAPYNARLYEFLNVDFGWDS